MRNAGCSGYMESLMLPRFRDIRVIIFSYPISWAITAAVHAVFLIFVRKRAFRKVHYRAAGSGAGSGIAAQ